MFDVRQRSNVKRISMLTRFLPPGIVSIRRSLLSILVTLYILTVANFGLVAACQLCFQNIVCVSNIPIPSHHLIALEPFPTEIDRYVKARERSTLKAFEYSGKSITFLPHKRRSNQPLYMMFNDASNNETLPFPDDAGISKVDTGTRTIGAAKNQTDFDSVKFFDDLQRSGDIGSNDTSKDSEENAMSAVMIGAIGFYKKVISPALPPACRFVPTCSTYGVQAIQEFGPAKGLVLIAWRILRCTPIGGKGYDPPKWPPVFYTFSSY